MSLKELEITTGRLLHVWWAYLWRAALVTLGAWVVSMIVGAIVGGVLGLAMHIGGYATQQIQAVAKVVGLVLGALIGIGFSIIPLKLILGKSFGDFRLVLVSNAKQPAEGETEHQKVAV